MERSSEEGCYGSVGERRGSRCREREGRIGWGSLEERREVEWMHAWKYSSMVG